MYGKNDYVNVPASFDKLIAIFDKIEPGSGNKLKKFIKKLKINIELVWIA